MENRPNLNSILLPLKEMAFRRIGVAMCNNFTILNKIATLDIQKYKFYGRRFCHSDIESNLSNLGLPQSLKKQMTPILKAVCDEIATWIYVHETYLNGDFCVSVLKKLRWTTAGTVNYRKTAEELVLSSFDELPDVANRFELACFYGLKSYISKLWRILPNEDKKIFYNGDISLIKYPYLQLFLPNVLERAGNKRRHNTVPRNFFARAAILGNKTLVDYYFAELTQEVKEYTLVQTARTVIRLRNTIECYLSKFDMERYLLSSVSCHLLSLMTVEEQNRLFNELPCEVLSCYLDWPTHDLFLDIAHVMWSFIPENKYEHLLNVLHRGFVISEFYFPDLFQEFFQYSPVDFRKRFIDSECKNDRFFLTFMRKEDTDTIKIVMRNLDPSDRVRLAFSEGVLNLIYQRRHNWPVMEVFLRELTLSKEEKRRLKEAVTEFVTKRLRIQWSIKEYERVFEFLDEGE